MVKKLKIEEEGAKPPMHPKTRKKPKGNLKLKSNRTRKRLRKKEMF